MNLICKITSNCKIPIVQVDWRFKLIQCSLTSQYGLRNLNKKSRKTGVYIHLFLHYKNSNSSNKNNLSNHSVVSHFTIYHSASFSSQLSITRKKNKIFTEEKFKAQNRYQLRWRKYVIVQNRYQLQWRKYVIYSTK